MDFIEWLKKQEAMFIAKEQELEQELKKPGHYIDGRNSKLTDCFLQHERITTALNLFKEYNKS